MNNLIATPETYDDARIEEISRRVFYTSMQKIENEMARDGGGNTERLAALADVAVAASSGFSGEEDDDDAPF